MPYVLCCLDRLAFDLGDDAVWYHKLIGSALDGNVLLATGGVGDAFDQQTLVLVRHIDSGTKSLGLPELLPDQQCLLLQTQPRGDLGLSHDLVYLVGSRYNPIFDLADRPVGCRVLGEPTSSSWLILGVDHDSLHVLGTTARGDFASTLFGVGTRLDGHDTSFLDTSTNVLGDLEPLSRHIKVIQRVSSEECMGALRLPEQLQHHGLEVGSMTFLRTFDDIEVSMDQLMLQNALYNVQ